MEKSTTCQFRTCYSKSRCIKDPVKHLRERFLRKYLITKKLHHICLTRYKYVWQIPQRDFRKLRKLRKLLLKEHVGIMKETLLERNLETP